MWDPAAGTFLRKSAASFSDEEEGGDSEGMPHGGNRAISRRKREEIMRLTRHTVKWATLGGATGVPMWLLALWCTGFGHGTYILITLSSSPLSLVPLPGFLCTPIVWAVIVALAAAPRTRRNRILFLALMAAHYMVAAALIAWTPLGDWGYVGVIWNRVPGVVIGWAIFYCLAQVLAWGAFLGGIKPTPSRKAAS
jgi:hypothetical protein